MKIIALGDIHGNLPALQVALRESRAEGYDLLCHTGDLVGFAPFPCETVELVRSEKIAGVRGDVDESAASAAQEFGGHGSEGARRRQEELAYAWTVGRLDAITRSRLADLPFDRRLVAGGRRTVLLHANPVDTTTCLTEDRDEDYFRDLGDTAEADILIFGHTHRRFHKIVDGRHFINAGSVGCAAGVPKFTEYSVITVNGDVEVQYRRFPYDVDRLARAAQERRFPADAVKMFRES